MDLFTAISWGISALSIYVAVYYLLLYLDSSKGPKWKKKYKDVTIAVPAYNEGKNIYATLLSLKKLKYPKRLIHVVVVDDASKDKTINEVKRFIKHNENFDIKLLVNKKNKGKAYSLNRVLKMTTSPFMVTMDADSEAHPKALSELINYSEGVSVVTPCVLPKSKKGIFERVQAIEYIYGNYLANLLSGFDAQIVAPGPFSLFKTRALREVNGFDENSVAEDLEIVFRLRKKGHSLRLAPNARIYTEIPQKLKNFILQRRRWRLGFLDAAKKHPKSLNPMSEFGRQNLMNSIYVFMTAVLFFLIIRNIKRILDPIIKVIRFVGFDFITYLKTINWAVDPLGIDAQIILYTIFLLVLTFFFLKLATKFHNIRFNFLDIFLFLFLYGLAITTATLLAVWSWIKGEYRW